MHRDALGVRVSVVEPRPLWHVGPRAADAGFRPGHWTPMEESCVGHLHLSTRVLGGCGVCAIPAFREQPRATICCERRGAHLECRNERRGRAYAAAHASPQWVDDLAGVKPLGALADIPKMKAQLPTYLTRAAGFTADISDVEAFSLKVLEWWRRNADDAISAWADAARIIFAISPNSASCERVFTLLKNMFGDQQMASLADYVQAALMLRYNSRKIG